MTTLSNPENKQKVATNHLWWVTIVAIVLAVVGNAILYFIANAAVAGGLTAVPPGETEATPLPLAVVIVATVVPAIVGAVILILLNRFNKPINIFRIIAVIVTILSFIPVFTLPASVSVGSKVFLALMHIVAAVAITGILTTFGRARS